MERFGFVGLPNAGKSSLYNALSGGSALAAPLRLRHQGPERRHGQGARRPPRPAGRDERLAQGGAGHRAVRRHRRAGRGGQHGRGPGQQVPGQHPRGRRHHLRAAGLRRRRRARARPTRSSTCASSRPSWPWPTWTRSRPRSTSGARRPSRTAPWPTRWPPSAGPSITWPRAPRSTAATSTPTTGRCCGPTSCSPTSRCWPWSTSARTTSTAPTRSWPRWWPSWAGGARSSACACSSRPRPPRSTPTSGPRCSRRSAWARARCPASCRPPTTCSACAPSSPPARRSPGPGRSGPGWKAPAVRRGHPRRLRAGLHPGRGHPLGRAARDRLVEQGPRRGQAARRGQGLRGGRRRRHGVPLQRVSGLPLGSIDPSRSPRRRVRRLAGWDLGRSATHSQSGPSCGVNAGAIQIGSDTTSVEAGGRGGTSEGGGDSRSGPMAPIGRVGAVPSDVGAGHPVGERVGSALTVGELVAGGSRRSWGSAFPGCSRP